MADETRDEAIPGLPEMTVARRKRLQQCFEHANRQMSQESYDYATELFTQCILGDPGNPLYLQSFLGNLKKKYNNNRKGSNLAFIQGSGPRRAAKKAASQRDWAGAFKNGLDALKFNPWDVATLTALADVCKELEVEEVELAYLKTALEANANDPDVARLCAIALGERKEFDQAIAMWNRVQKARPDDDEVQRAISRLAVEKTIDRQKQSTAEELSDAVRQPGETTERLTPEQRLEKSIQRDPENLATYLQLADVYLRREEFEPAVDVLKRAQEASDGDVEVSEKLEDTELRLLRQRIAKTEQDFADDDEQGKRKFEELRKALFRKEMEVYEKRCARYPTNLAFKYELGVRYQLNGLFSEAIQQYQQARNDPRRRGMSLLNLGACFERIRQYRLAISHYQEAIEEIPDRDADNKKKALYQASKLAMKLKDYESAEKNLTALAGFDFGYKDVSTLLDKVASLRDDKQSE